MKILIVGYYGFRNLGDEAILSSMLGELRNALSDPQFVVTSGEPALTAAEHGVGAIYWRDIPAIVRTVADSDLVILGGGGLFHDLWGFPGHTLLTADHWGIPFFAGPAVLAAMYGKPLALYAVGVEAISDPMARQMTRAVFEISSSASVRDEVSASFVRGLGVDESRFTVTADPVWLLGSKGGKASQAPGAQGGTERSAQVGVALRGWDIGLDPDVWMGEVAAAVEAFARATGARVLMVPFQVLAEEEGYDDRKVAREVVARFEDPRLASIAPVPLDGREGVEAFRNCDLVLGMRYHALVCAALAGKPVVGLAYAPKVHGLMSQLGMDDLCFPLSTVGRKKLGSSLQRVWDSREELETALKGRTAKLIMAGRQNSRLISDLASGEVAPPPETPAAKALLLESSVGAIVCAATRTAEVLNLVSERDGARKRREELERQLLELRVRHEGLQKEREGLAQQLGEERERGKDLDRRLSELEVWHENRKKEHEELQEGHKALEAAYHDLKKTFDEIVSSKLYAVLSTVWRIRGAMRVRGRRSARTSAAKQDASKEDDLKSWETFAFERFKETMRRRFPGISQALRTRGAIRSVSVVVLMESPGQDLAATLKCLDEQHRADLETVVVVPGGSREPLEEARRLIADRDEKVEIVEAPGVSAPALLWEGARRCSGDVVLWVHAGDLAHPAAVDRMAGTLEESTWCDGVCAAYAMVGGAPEEGLDEGRGTGGRRSSPDLCTFNVDPGTVEPPWAVMVRRAVLDLIGPPGDLVGTLGLADVLMRVNEAVALRVVSEGPVLFLKQVAAGARSRHDTSSEATGMAVFDDYRRNLLQSQMLWSFTSAGDRATSAVIETLVAMAREERDVVDAGRQGEGTGSSPRLWLPSALVRVDPTELEADEGPRMEPPGLLVTEEIGASQGDRWDLTVTVRRDPVPNDGCPPGTWHVQTEKELFHVIRLLAMFRHSCNLESEAARWKDGGKPLKASVIVCTHRPIPPLESALESLAHQDMDPRRLEVIIVNNDPENKALRETLVEIETRQFKAGAVRLRHITCPIPGLSHARNAGIAAARGEILLFLDDDAVARPDWVSTAVSLFAENPEYGIIGGYIRLVPPEPKPSVINPGWERYWSQYLGERERLYEVEEWWNYPWGASWCARRSVLLRMGGFRVGYGRTKGDFAGGEEVIAASLAHRLGWRIGVAPELEVAHRVIAERFTWKHVKKTLMVGTLGNYRMQRDLYIPMDGMGWTARCLFSPSVDRTVGANSALARLRHWSYRKRAWARLLAWQLRDRLARRKPPRYGSPC